MLILALAFFLYRRRRKSQASRSPSSPTTPQNAELPMQGANIIRIPVSPIQPAPSFLSFKRGSRHSIAPSYYGTMSVYEPATPFPPPSRAPSVYEPATPFPPPSRAPSVNYALPSRARTRTLSVRSVVPSHSRSPSVRSITPSHSRGPSGTSVLSTTPMMPVPIIRLPRSPPPLPRQAFDPNFMVSGDCYLPVWTCELSD